MSKGARVSSNILQSRTGPLYFESSERTCMRADNPNFLYRSIDRTSVYMRAPTPATFILLSLTVPTSSFI